MGNVSATKRRRRLGRETPRPPQELLTATLEKLESKTKDKKLAGAYNNLGLVAEMQGDLQAAHGHYQKALEANAKPNKETKKGVKRVEKLLGAWQAYYAMGAPE